MSLKRLFDLFFTVPGLLVLGPLMLGVAVWIKWDSPGLVLFRQRRVGRFGQPFYVLKYRTMVVDAESMGPKITVGQDPRITRSGAFLRKYKLDELTQLINVLKGQMSLVGPRPEVPQYVEKWSQEDKRLILSIRPGITDYASFYYSDEQEVLSHAEDPELAYVNEVMPHKLKLYRKYVRERNLWLDFRIILATLAKIMGFNVTILLPELRD